MQLVPIRRALIGSSKRRAVLLRSPPLFVSKRKGSHDQLMLVEHIGLKQHRQHYYYNNTTTSEVMMQIVDVLRCILQYLAT